MKLIIPEYINLSELKLGGSSSTDGNIEFDWALIEDICNASGIDISEFLDSYEDNACGLIHQWYAEHKARGGEDDPVMEDMIATAKIEEMLDGLDGRKPGSA
ncbi:MAG: hypothetical protein ACREUR_01805 [Nitrosospira sp.]